MTSPANDTLTAIRSDDIRTSLRFAFFNAALASVSATKGYMDLKTGNVSGLTDLVTVAIVGTAAIMQYRAARAEIEELAHNR